MSNTPATLKLEDLAIEPLSELCKVAYEETAWALESTLKKAINFGRLLCIAKAKIPHGGWSVWSVYCLTAKRTERAQHRRDLHTPFFTQFLNLDARPRHGAFTSQEIDLYVLRQL